MSPPPGFAAFLAAFQPGVLKKVYAAGRGQLRWGMKRVALFAAVFSMSAAVAQAPQSHLIGDWREPGGSVIRVAPCSGDLCARLVQISATAPSKLDGHNPDTSKRKEPLCGMQIGTGFHVTDPNHADDGRLYDPKTGKTYHGEMTREGDTMHLRGYVGIKAFGRTEDWNRISELKSTCG